MEGWETGELSKICDWFDSTRAIHIFLSFEDIQGFVHIIRNVLYVKLEWRHCPWIV